MIRTIYLGGKIDGLSYEDATRERNIIKKKLRRIGIKGVDPMRGKGYLKGSKIDHDSVKFRSDCEMQDIISRDINDINNCDALVVLSGDQPSWGTAMEASYVHFHLNKPYFVISKNATRYGWLHFLASKVFPTTNDFIEYLKNFWNKEV